MGNIIDTKVIIYVITQNSTVSHRAVGINGVIFDSVTIWKYLILFLFNFFLIKNKLKKYHAVIHEFVFQIQGPIFHKKRKLKFLISMALATKAH